MIARGTALTSHRRATGAATGPFSPTSWESEVKGRAVSFLSRRERRGPAAALAADGK